VRKASVSNTCATMDIVLIAEDCGGFKW